MIQLSRRLKQIADQVIPGYPIADIGSDHALLPVFLVQQGVIPKAIAGDLHAGPLRAAQQQVSAAGLEHQIFVRAGDGLFVFQSGEAHTVVVAGMGGATITSILDRGREQLHGVRRLVLQPNNGEPTVREWLRQAGWKLYAEHLIEEDGIMYEVLSADAADHRQDAQDWNQQLYTRPLPFEKNVSTEIRLLMGPWLLEAPSALFVRKWQAYLMKIDQLLPRMVKSNQPEAKRRIEHFCKQREEIQGVLACLSL
jgi:tRNA (adenine22-N1)-methyltransferase